MFPIPPKFLSSLVLAAIVCGCVWSSAQQTPAPPTDKSSDTAVPEAAPITQHPYVLEADYRYTWVCQGEEVGTTTMTIRTVTDADGRPTLQVNGRLDYERAGRLLTGSSTLTFEGLDLRHPARFRGSLETGVPDMGSQKEKVAIKFEDGKAHRTLDPGVGRLYTTERELQPPTWVLEAQCFEHWAILSPHLEKIVSDGKISVYVPTAGEVMTYTVRHERSEESGKERRERWAVEHPAMKAKLWTDAEGRLVEYAQEEIQIILSEVKLPEKTATAPKGAK